MRVSSSATGPSAWSSTRAMRKFLALSSVSLFGLLLLLSFLMPLGYMFTTSFKTIQQIIDPAASLLPMSPTFYTYAGQEYPLYNVPTPQGLQEWALYRKGREDSDFIDPANPSAGPIKWIGRWRTLEPVVHLDIHIENFGIALDTVKFPLLFRNTFIIAIAGTIGTLLSSIAVAYGFSRFRLPGKNALFFILISTIILPIQVTLIPKYVFFRVIGWGGTWWPLIIPHFFANAYNVFLLRQYFRSIPKELDEAAMLDGATPLQTLLYVIVPQSWPVITAVAMFHFFFAWNDFFEPLVYLQGKEDLYPISVGLTQFANAFGSRPELLMAASLMAVALPLVMFFAAQRVFMQGIVITGVEK
jgi:multiple sugar transport system permease protein